jgi:hypothetical protein
MANIEQRPICKLRALVGSKLREGTASIDRWISCLRFDPGHAVTLGSFACDLFTHMEDSHNSMACRAVQIIMFVPCRSRQQAA